MRKTNIRVQAVDAADCVAEEEWLSVFVEMDVAQLRDAKSVECGGKAAKRDTRRCETVDPVALDFAGVERNGSQRTRL